MFKLSDNYYHRKCYFKREQVPTQTVIKKIMTPPLAMVYFKDMTPKRKKLAGLEPPLQGSGADWFQSPDELLKGRAVLQPVKNEYLILLGQNVIDIYGDVLMINHQLHMQAETRKALADNDAQWKERILRSCAKQSEDTSYEEGQKNTQKILMAFAEFQMLYTTCTTRVDNILKDAAQDEMQRVLDQAYEHMSEQFKILIKKQATMLYDRYTERLNKEKEKLKAAFILKIQQLRTDLGEQLLNINLDKHMAIEKVRHLLECQNLACQVYVALKERERCAKEIDQSKYYHKKKVRHMTEEIRRTECKIREQEEQEIERQEFNRIWKKKICHVIKKFQIFVEYCVRVMPQHEEFFANMQELMMTQLNEAAENPTCNSLFETEENLKSPRPRPHPFYMCCDTGYKPQFDQDLCPKHCTSSASHMPVIIVNKQCIYAACDNFEKLTEKITEYINGKKGDDVDLEDDQEYHGVPVKQTMSTKLEELKLESSLMQILQEELPNVKKVRTECCVCRIPYCFCSDLHPPAPKVEEPPPAPPPVIDTLGPGVRLERPGELTASREPKWESYMEYVRPKKCKCPKTAKKHLHENIPPYMRTMSKFDTPELPHYETCPLPLLKKLVKKARKVVTPPPTPPPPEPKAYDVHTQYEDKEYEELCKCYSRDEAIRLFNVVKKELEIFKSERQCDVVRDIPTSSQEDDATSVTSDVTNNQYLVAKVLKDEPELQKLFNATDCTEFNDK